MTARPRSMSITLGDQTLEVEYFVHGSHAPATLIDPEEFPEIELHRLLTPGGEDVSGLLQFDAVGDAITDKIEAQLEEDRLFGSDPDDAYDRARDERMEERA